jgi:alginate O-acetyltransferase complex protein AlgI
MVFSSLVFLFIFFPVTLLLYYLVPKSFRNTFLLFASIVFFAWGGISYTIILFISILTNYLIGLLINRNLNTNKARYFLVLGVIINLGILVIFKYANFIIDNANDILTTFKIDPIANENILLPIGISFYTFQALSYIIDVYRKETEVQKNLINLALFISLFPQLIAGPIVRYHDINLQLTKRKVDFNKFASGIERFIIGLGKKVLLANTFAAIVDSIFAMDPSNMSAITLWFGIILYALQIYFDFSGYSDMAIGLGKMFGFNLLENFNFPYIANSIQDFWRRWHKSLSTWFRDYLYIPLGGNRVNKYRVYLNLFIVFLLTGFWHGASWNFIIWGLFHGLFLITERIGFGGFLSKIWSPIRHFYVIIVVLISWVFFRADDLTYAMSYLNTMFGGSLLNSELWMLNKYINSEVIIALAIGLLGSSKLFVQIPYFLRHKFNLTKYKIVKKSLSGVVGIVSALFLFSVLLLSITYLSSNSYNPFIYFRF